MGTYGGGYKWIMVYPVGQLKVNRDCIICRLEAGLTPARRFYTGYNPV